MAFIMKPPFENSPGLIIFTHKEFAFFQDEAGLGEHIDSLRKNYVLGIHWGHYHGNVIPPRHIDFHLAGPGTLDLAPGYFARRLPFCSRNFAPAVFCPDGEGKFWDILSVARPLRLKYLDQFFGVLQRVMLARPATRVLLLCADIPGTDPQNAYVEIAEDFRKMFTAAEQENITLLLLSPKLYPFPLSQSSMAFFYNRSRVFTLFSRKEGESRVITEALLCGLPVVARADLVGGGRDYLNETNSILFLDSEQAAAAFLSLLNSPARTFDVNALAEEMRSDRTVPKFLAALGSVFADLGHSFAGAVDMEFLDRKLPGHANILPAELRNPITDDIPDEMAFKRFVAYALNGVSNGERSLWQATVTFQTPPLAVRIRQALRRGRRFLGSVRRLTRRFL